MNTTEQRSVKRFKMLKKRTNLFTNVFSKRLVFIFGLWQPLRVRS